MPDMSNGLAVFAFYALVGAVWAFLRITTPQERQSALEWALIAIAVFGAAGFAYELFRG